MSTATDERTVTMETLERLATGGRISEGGRTWTKEESGQFSRRGAGTIPAAFFRGAIEAGQVTWVEGDLIDGEAPPAPEPESTPPPTNEERLRPTENPVGGDVLRYDHNGDVLDYMLLGVVPGRSRVWNALMWTVSADSSVPTPITIRAPSVIAMEDRPERWTRLTEAERRTEGYVQTWAAWERGVRAGGTGFATLRDRLVSAFTQMTNQEAVRLLGNLGAIEGLTIHTHTVRVKFTVTTPVVSRDSYSGGGTVVSSQDGWVRVQYEGTITKHGPEGCLCYTVTARDLDPLIPSGSELHRHDESRCA